MNNLMYNLKGKAYSCQGVMICQNPRGWYSKNMDVQELLEKQGNHISVPSLLYQYQNASISLENCQSDDKTIHSLKRISILPS